MREGHYTTMVGTTITFHGALFDAIMVSEKQWMFVCADQRKWKKKVGKREQKWFK